jgi:tetratricopeptide (TPR) repeat protein
VRRAASLLALLAVAVLWAEVSSADADAELALADRAWAERDVGADDRGHTRPERIGAAIAAYERALAATPLRIDVHWKRVRALYFAGEFASAGDNESEQWFARARVAAIEAVDALDEAVPGMAVPSELSADELAAALPQRLHPDVAALHLWSGIAWGAWTRFGSLFAIVRTGVPGKLKRYAEITIALDPALEQGGGHRLLAALHRSMPRVPLYSGWVDRDRAFVELDRALEISPTYPGNRLLLALTILDLAPERRDEAMLLLEEVAGTLPDPSARVEQLAMREGARERLEEERARQQ